MSNIRLNLLDAFQQNPDQYAKNNAIGREIGLPGGLVNDDDRRAFKAKQVEDNIKNLPISGKLFSTTAGAILAQDDAEKIAAMERATAVQKLARARQYGEDLKQRLDGPGFMHGSLREIGLHLKKIPKAIWQNMNDEQVQNLRFTMETLEARGELTPQMKERIERDIAVYSRQYEEAGTKVAQLNEQIADLQPRDMNWAQKVVRGATTSLPYTLAALGISAASRNPVAGPVALGMSVSETSTADARLDGLSYDDARYKGMVDGVAEGAFEIVPTIRMLKLFNRGGGDAAQTTVKDILKAAGGATVSDMVGENATQLVQDANNLLHGLDAQWEDAIQKHGFFSPQALKIQAERQLLATGISGLTSSVISSPVVGRQVIAQMRQDHMERLQNLESAQEAARDSKMRERAPEEFYQLTDELAEFGDHPHIYIDGQALQDNALIDALLEAAPEYQDAVQEAIENGGSVQIKMADVLAKLSPNIELTENIREHVRFEPDGLSIHELQQNNAAAEIAENVDSALQDQAEQDARQAQVQAIHDEVYAQLSDGGRFAPQAVESYALLASETYSRLAQDLGVTPQEAMQQHPLNIVFGDVQGGGFEQALAAHPPRGWKHSTNDADFADIWNGNTKDQAAFQTEGLQKLLTAIPSLDGYSFSLSRSAAKHVRKKHGNPVTEKARGQVAITDTDMSRVPDIFREYDHMRFADMNDNKKILIAKTYQDGTILVLAESSRKKRDIGVSSVWKFPSTANAQSVFNHASSLLNLTSETEAGISQTPVANNNNTYPQNPQSPRGAYDPATGTITLTPNANLSTFIHEFGHHALEVTIAAATHLTQKQAGGDALTKGQQKIVNQTHSLLQSVGLDLNGWNALSFEEKRPFHEQIARTFETYIMTGQAPSVELQGAFARFKAWLFSIYKRLRNLNAPLSDEVKVVFDRMIASDAAIEEMRRNRGLSPMYQTAEEAGMTEEEFAVYQQEWQQAKDTAKDEMHQRNARDVQYIRNLRARHLKKLQKEAREVRKQVEDEVREQLMGQPAYRAEEVLKIKQEGDAPLLRLNREALRELGYSEVEIKALGRKVHNNGMHPDELAGFILDEAGNPIYDSGAALVQDLLQAQPLEEAVLQIADEIMLERYGELSSPEAIAEAADMAAYNEFSVRAIAREANALAQAMGSPSVLASSVRALAKQVIGTKVIKDLKPQQYSRMATRLGREAEKARKQGDVATAARLKKQQAMQAAMAREAYERKEALASQVRELRKKAKLDPKKVEIESREIIEQILSRFGLGVEPQQSRKLGEWLAEKEAQGYDPDIADFVQDESVSLEWNRLTFDQFQALEDAIDSIHHIGKTERTAFLQEHKLRITDITDEMGETAEENGSAEPIDNRAPVNARGRMARFAHKFIQQARRMNMTARQMDGNKDGGIVWRYLIKPTNKQANMEVSLKAKITELTAPFLESISRGSAGIRHAYTLGGKTVTLTDREIFRMATNWGNEGNRQRLLDGEGWTQDEVEALFEARLTEADWKSIQGIWDVHESLRPEVARVARNINGKEPTWVEAVPFTIQTADGATVALKGGYVPIKYDVRRSHRAAEQQQLDIQNGRASRATVRSGMTKDRAQRVKNQPLDYTINSLFNGLDETIHYIAWAEWQMDMNRILGDNAFTRTVRDRYGADVLEQMQRWKDDIVTGNSRQAMAGDAVAAWLRGNISMANIGFSTMSAIAQIFGLFQSIVRVGAREIGNASLRYITDFKEMGARADTLSEAMRNRDRTMFRELTDLRSKIGEQTKAKALMSRYAYWMLLRMQRAVDVITWNAQFEKSLANGATEADAAAQADQAVIDSQGSGLTNDLSAIERGSEALKLFTVHYGFMNTILNLNYNVIADKQMKFATKFYNVMMVVFVMQMAEGAFRALLTPGDDDQWETDNLLPMAAGKMVDGTLGQFVFLREFTGMMGGYEGTIGTGLFPRANKAWNEIKDGDFDVKALRAMVGVIGATTGAPSAQINRTIKGAEAYFNDKTDNPAAFAFGYQE